MIPVNLKINKLFVNSVNMTESNINILQANNNCNNTVQAGNCMYIFLLCSIIVGYDKPMVVRF